MPNSIISQDQDGKELFCAISAFFCKFKIGYLLRTCNAQKEEGGHLFFPIAKACYGAKYAGEIRIADDVVTLEAGISDEESMLAMINIATDKRIFTQELAEIRSLSVSQVMDRHQQYLGRRFNGNSICFWGAGKFFMNNLERIQPLCKNVVVCDADSAKWGSEITEGIKCISPDELSKMKNVIVLIMVTNKSEVLKVEKTLERMGIKEYVDGREWLDIVY